MKFFRSENGFTLVEILIVIAILAVLFVLLLPMFGNGSLKAQERGIMTDFRNFQTGAESYLRETIGKPISEDTLNNFLDKGMEVSGGVANAQDPWGNAYVFDIKDNQILFKSIGKDKIEDSSDDYIFSTYLVDGKVASCTSGFQNNNIKISLRVSDDFICGDSIVVINDESEFDSTDATVELPTELNNGCYVIRTIGQLQAMGISAPARPSCYELGNDIDASGTASWSSKGFAPIGDVINQFYGSLDGKGYVISNLTIKRSSEEYIGLFGYTYDAVIENVILENVHIVGDRRVGGLAGYLKRTRVENVTITGSVTGNIHVGGITGGQYQSQIINSYHLPN